MTIEEFKNEKIKLAREWAIEGFLTVSQVSRLFNKSESCIRKWYEAGKLERAKEDEEMPFSPVRIPLQSVLTRISKFNFV